MSVNVFRHYTKYVPMDKALLTFKRLNLSHVGFYLYKFVAVRQPTHAFSAHLA